MSYKFEIGDNIENIGGLKGVIVNFVNAVAGCEKLMKIKFSSGAIQYYTLDGDLYDSGYKPLDDTKLIIPDIGEKKIMFKVGDQVETIISGETGVVNNILDISREKYPIKVVFEDNSIEYYTLDGKVHYSESHPDDIIKAPIDVRRPHSEIINIPKNGIYCWVDDDLDKDGEIPHMYRATIVAYDTATDRYQSLNGHHWKYVEPHQPIVKIGDQVTDEFGNFGVVVNLTGDNNEYPIVIKFNDTKYPTREYSNNGEMNPTQLTKKYKITLF